MTSKYRRLSSCGTALIPGTLSRHESATVLILGASAKECNTYGSAIRRSVSFMILLGNAAILLGVPNPPAKVFLSALKMFNCHKEASSLN